MHQGYSLCHRKPPPKFEIEALFRQVILYIHRRTKKHITVKSIHSSLRSESKIKYNYTNYQDFNSFNCGHLCLKFLQWKNQLL